MTIISMLQKQYIKRQQIDKCTQRFITGSALTARESTCTFNLLISCLKVCFHVTCPLFIPLLFNTDNGDGVDNGQNEFVTRSVCYSHLGCVWMWLKTLWFCRYVASSHLWGAQIIFGFFFQTCDKFDNELGNLAEWDGGGVDTWNLYGYRLHRGYDSFAHPWIRSFHIGLMLVGVFDVTLGGQGDSK